MANGWGQQNYGASAGGATLSADGAPEYVTAGVTIDWATCPAASGDLTLPDGQVIPSGTKYIPFGCILAKITASGKYGPHEADAADGRQTLTKGSCFLVNQTVTEADAHSEYLSGGGGGGAFDGGKIYTTRLKRLNDAATAYIAHTVDATFNTAFPRIRFAEH